MSYGFKIGLLKLVSKTSFRTAAGKWALRTVAMTVGRIADHYVY